jgi:hypothetical protein
VTLFMPKGIVGIPSQLRELSKKWKRRPIEPAETPAPTKFDAVIEK